VLCSYDHIACKLFFIVATDALLLQQQLPRLLHNECVEHERAAKEKKIFFKE